MCVISNRLDLYKNEGRNLTDKLCTQSPCTVGIRKSSILVTVFLQRFFPVQTTVLYRINRIKYRFLLHIKFI